MPDIAKINGATATDIVKIDGAASADVVKIDGNSAASTAVASYWAICFDDNQTSWAANADIASESEWADNIWTTHGDGGSVDMIDIAYGKDGSGNPIFLAIANSSGNNVWVDQNNDITDNSTWTRINLSSTAKRQTIQWGDDVWIAAGNVSASNVNIHRSTDGAASFSAIDVSGATNISTTEKIKALASDGAGNWMFGQKANLYFSSDDGASWAWLIQPSGASGDFIRDIVYTNGSWVVLYSAGGNAKMIACVGSTAANMDDSGDWGTAVTLTGNFTDDVGNETSQTLNGNSTKRMAAANGRIVAMQMGNGPNGARTIGADVSAKVITLDSSGTIQRVPFTAGTAQCIATDGTTWLAGGDGSDVGRNGGEICRSTNGGDSWALIVEGIDNHTANKVNGIAPDLYLPIG